MRCRSIKTHIACGNNNAQPARSSAALCMSLRALAACSQAEQPYRGGYSLCLNHRAAARCRAVPRADGRLPAVDRRGVGDSEQRSDAAGIALGAGRPVPRSATPCAGQARESDGGAGRGPRNPRLRRPTLSGDPSRRQGINTGYAGRGGA